MEMGCEFSFHEVLSLGRPIIRLLTSSEASQCLPVGLALNDNGLELICRGHDRHLRLAYVVQG